MKRVGRWTPWSCPRTRDRFASITVHQLGWRLGGKGASGRNVERGHRIEEHGLHVWFGFYENAFRMLDRCHRELDALAAPADDSVGQPRWSSHHRSVATSFHSVDRVGLMEDVARAWRPWVAEFPCRAGLPWDRDLDEERTAWPPEQMLADFVTQLVELGRSVVGSLEGGFRQERRHSLEAQTLIDVAGRVLGRLASVTGSAPFQQLLASAVARPGDAGRTFDVAAATLGGALATLDRVIDVLGARLGRVFWWNEEVRRLWAITDLVLAVARGFVDDRVVDDDALDALDQHDFRTWLVRHGACYEAVDGPFVRAVVYDLAFAYRAGRSPQPACGAGTALRGMHRLLFTYQGALMWKMNGGMGDVVFMPLYELLTKRGVQFEFFHQVTNLALDGDRVTRVEYRQQAPPPGDPKEHLVCTEARAPFGPGLCWPSAPAGCSEEDARKLESTWWRAGTRHHIDVGERDIVVLGIGLGALPYVAHELIARSRRWADMVEAVETVPTEALQIWLGGTLGDLGWESDAIVGGYGKPFDTWSDMPAPLMVEAHPPDGPRGLAYFCSAADLTDVALDVDPLTDDDALQEHYQRAWHDADKQLREDVDDFVAHRLPRLWPGTSIAAGDDQPSLDVEVDRYKRINIDPTDRYVLSVPGSSGYRIAPGRTGFTNLFVAGDWTECTLNAGCVEAAVISGMAAARAITGEAGMRIIGERRGRWPSHGT